MNPHTIGCGVGPLTTSKEDIFYPACVWHDKAYTRGSKYQEYMSRGDVDDIFLSKMLDIAEDNATKTAKAFLYYGLVRIFGGIFWEGKSSD